MSVTYPAFTVSPTGTMRHLASPFGSSNRPACGRGMRGTYQRLNWPETEPERPEYDRRMELPLCAACVERWREHVEWQHDWGDRALDEIEERERARLLRL